MIKRDLVDVIEVQISAPHSRRVLATKLTPGNAEAFILAAIARRGVDTHFYTTEPASVEIAP